MFSKQIDLDEFLTNHSNVEAYDTKNIRRRFRIKNTNYFVCLLRPFDSMFNPKVMELKFTLHLIKCLLLPWITLSESTDFEVLNSIDHAVNENLLSDSGLPPEVRDFIVFNLDLFR